MPFTYPAPVSPLTPRHRIKSKDNRDKRVELLQDYARQFFPSTRYLAYAVTVEEYTLQKSSNLVLNVDVSVDSLILGSGTPESRHTHRDLAAGQ